MKSKTKKIIIAVLAVLLAIEWVVGWTYVRDYRLGNFDGKAELYVYPQTTPKDVINMLADTVNIYFPKALERVFRFKQVDRYITPGHYLIDTTTTSVTLARMLNNGWQTPVTLTLGGTLRFRSDISRKIAAQMMVSEAQMDKALCDSALLAGLGYTPENLFSLFIPDSYNIFWSSSPAEILTRMKKANDAFWTEENLAKAQAQGLSREEVSILASIVKGESNYGPELPKIAGVYLNRLHKGMLLQADPTVAYCFDYSLDRVLFKHLEVDSPYNTYKYPGLPPGPICVPTRACLEAVLNPDTADGYLYFCASPEFNGTHVFAKNMYEHGRNARKFQNELTKRRRAKKAAQAAR